MSGDENQVSVDPKTRDEFLMYRGVHYGGAAATFLVLLQLAGRSWSVLDFFALSLLGVASVGFLSAGIMFEIMSMHWDRLRLRSGHDFYKKYTDRAVILSVSFAFIGGFALMRGVLCPVTWSFFSRRSGAVVFVAFALSLLFMIRIHLDGKSFRRGISAALRSDGGERT